MAVTTRQTTAFGSGGVGLAEACRVSALLRTPEPDGPKPWIWWGIFVHRFLEYSKTLGRAEALAYIAKKYPRALKMCRRIDVGSIPDGDVEVSYAHHTRARSVRRFKYPEQPHPTREVGGRADLVVGAELHVVDYKSGGRPANPLSSTQLLGLLVARRVELGANDQGGKVSIVGVRKDGALIWRTAGLSAGEVDEQEARVLRVHLQVLEDRRALAAGEGLPPHGPGPHCWGEYCPHRHGCAEAPPPPD